MSFLTLSLRKNTSQKRTLILFLCALLLPMLRFVVNELSMVVQAAHSALIAFRMQNVSIADFIERLALGRLLIPPIEGLSGNGEARILPELSDVELTNLMLNSNRMAVVLVHLQGVVEDLHQVQFREYTRRLSDRGELGEAETVATQIVEVMLDEEFGELEEYRQGMGWE